MKQRLWWRIAVCGCAATAAILSVGPAPAAAQPSDAPLQLETKIPLGALRGRIDHMAIDLDRRRLFVAELGNDSVGVVDLDARKPVHRIGGLKEPQGVGYLGSSDTLFVANGGDGSVRLFQGADYAANGRIDLGDDADNVRVDPTANRIVVGYGSGALGVIEAAGRSRIADIRLPAHPESFQIDPGSKRIYVNVPNRHIIAVIDQSAGKQIANWPMSNAGANFPMALDEGAHRVLVMFRSPARLGVFAMQDGGQVAAMEACGDADDLFIDAKRHLVYVSCGEGVIDVFDAQTYRRTARIPTVPGARTSFFAPELDRFMVAVRATAREPAAIWLFRPVP
ncbi:MAG TPA: YncE family protein [Xanthobacteraceae bacterium]|nr:YncE family protein [Xanthobacteraceae bacterium]